MTVMSLWMGWRPKSPVPGLFVPLFVQAQIKYNIGITGLCEGHLPVTKGHYCGKFILELHSLVLAQSTTEVPHTHNFNARAIEM